MSNTEGVRTALAAWLSEVDPDGPLLISTTAARAAILHYSMTLHQEMIEAGAPVTDEGIAVVGLAHKDIEAALVQAGYGGDPRP